MTITIKTLIFTVVVPGTVVIIIPIFLSMIWYQKVELGVLRLLGGFLILLGLFLYFYSVLSFLNEKGTPMIFFMKKMEKIFGIEPEKLVKSGLYQYTRNPMYLGVVLLSLGEGLIFQLPIVIIWAVFCFIIFHFVVYFIEEPHLMRKHGKEYEDYLKNTPRWICIRKTK
ncbi:MAG: isoprenylcysteine carboxylmethyltransferase family protein [Candidatus Heimdallarchaeota archaeon]|nr:MAG: isoprenylcysteine carboxylmethyltransferase family protein [Candidatus Heimdallarchaeota archaeon]